MHGFHESWYFFLAQELCESEVFVCNTVQFDVSQFQSFLRPHVSALSVFFWSPNRNLDVNLFDVGESDASCSVVFTSQSRSNDCGSRPVHELIEMT